MRIVGSSPTASAANRMTTREATIGSRPFRTTRSEQKDPVVQRQRLLAYTQATMVRVHPGLLSIEASGRCQPAGSSGGYLGSRRGVRPSPPPCHGGDRGFKSHRGRFEESREGTVRKSAKRRSSNLRGLWVRLPLVPLGGGRGSRRASVVPCTRD